MTDKYSEKHANECGTIFIVTMWVVFALAGLCLTFAQSARTDLAGGADYAVTTEVEAAVRGALRWLMVEFDGADGTDLTRPFAEQAPWQIGEVKIWITPPGADDSFDLSLFSVRDEGSLINLNSAPREALSALPGASAEMADSIIAWRGSGEATIGGDDNGLRRTELDRYKRGPFETVEELLLLPNFHPGLLYGSAVADRDIYFGINGFPHRPEQITTGTTATVEEGWFKYVTAYSRPAGRQRQAAGSVDVNQADARQMRELLRPYFAEEELSETVVRLRQNQPFANIVDFFFHTGLSVLEFTPLLENVRVDSEVRSHAQININTVPRHVLLCLPGIGSEEADRLISHRRTADFPMDNILWIAEVLPRETAVSMANFVAARSFQVSADITAMDRDSRIFRRYRAVIDIGPSPPRVLYWKDISHLGWPMGWHHN